MSSEAERKLEQQKLSSETERKLEQQKFKFQELAIQFESLNVEIDHFFDQLNISPEQLSYFLERKEHFSERTWKELLKRKKELDQKLQLQLDCIRNPLKTKDSYKSLHVARHWLHVK